MVHEDLGIGYCGRCGRGQPLAQLGPASHAMPCPVCAWARFWRELLLGVKLRCAGGRRSTSCNAGAIGCELTGLDKWHGWQTACGAARSR